MKIARRVHQRNVSAYFMNTRPDAVGCSGRTQRLGLYFINASFRRRLQSRNPVSTLPCPKFNLLRRGAGSSSSHEKHLWRMTMLKPVIAAAAILAIAGSTFVYAQQGGYRGFRDGGPRFEQRHRLSAEDVSAFADARIAALKAGLELTADQTKNWPAFEAALRNMVQLRIDRIKARQAAQQQDQAQTPPTSPFDRLAKRADAMSKRSVALKQIADAGAPLYQSLNEDQKARFTMLARMLRPHQHGFNGGERREGRNFDRDGRGHDGRGQEGRGWGGRRFGENGQDGRGWRHGHLHNLMNSDGDQGSQL